MHPVPRSLATVSSKLLGTLLSVPKWFDLERQNLVWQHVWASSVFQVVSHSPSQGGGASASLNILGARTYTHSVGKRSQVLHGDQIRCEENFYMADYKCQHAICLW